MVRSKRLPGGFFRWYKGTDPEACNRRSSRRFAAHFRPAEIGWVEGQTFVKMSASLMDMSLSGISALTDAALPESTTIWVSLCAQSPDRWVKAVVVDVKRIRRLLTYRKSRYQIRMRFGAGCPYTFFRAVIEGRHAAIPHVTVGDRTTSPQV